MSGTAVRSASECWLSANFISITIFFSIFFFGYFSCEFLFIYFFFILISCQVAKVGRVRHSERVAHDTEDRTEGVESSCMSKEA